MFRRSRELRRDFAIWRVTARARSDYALMFGISEIRSFGKGALSCYSVRCGAPCERVMDIRYMNDVQFHGTIVT